MLNKIFIIAGHGKGDPGAIAEDGTTEREIVQRTTSIISDSLVEKIGVHEELSYLEKINLVNLKCQSEKLNWDNSILVSVHADYSQASSGVMAYYYDGSDRSQNLAQTILTQLSQTTGLKNKGPRPDTASRFGRIGMVRDTIPLSILVEIGSLGEDLNFLKKEANQLKITDAIIKGVKKFANIKVNEDNNSNSNSDNISLPKKRNSKYD